MWIFPKRIQEFSSPQAVLLLFVLGLAAYANAISHPFVHDDIVFIQNNPRISQLNIKDIFDYTAPAPHEPSVVNAYYRPFLELVYRSEYRLFGLNPHGYHLFNILVHIANSILVYGILLLILPGRKTFVLSAAALFLLHPVQTEAVACIAGISNLSFAFLGLGSLYFYLVSRRPSTKQKIVFYALSLLLFFVSLLAKEQAVTLLLLIILWEMCFGKTSGQRGVVQLLGYVIIFAGYMIFRQSMLAGALGFPVILNAEFGLRVLSIAGTLLIYLKIFFFPADLHYYRSVDILQPFIASWILLLIILGGTAYFISRAGSEERKILIFGGGWFILSLAPTLNIIPLVNEYSWILAAEHFLYLPLAGLIVFVLRLGGNFMERVFPKAPRSVNTVILIAVFITCLSLTIKQNTYWKDEVALFERTLRFERLGRVHILLAKAYYQQGKYFDAIAEGNEAVSIFDSYLKKTTDKQVGRIYLGFMKGAYFDLARSYQSAGDLASAGLSYEKALVIDPLDSTLHNSAGVFYAQTGSLDKAVGHFEKAVHLDSSDFNAKFNLALGYARNGKLGEAKELLGEIIEKDKAKTMPLAQNMLNDLMKEEAGQ